MLTSLCTAQIAHVSSAEAKQALAAVIKGLKEHEEELSKMVGAGLDTLSQEDKSKLVTKLQNIFEPQLKQFGFAPGGLGVMYAVGAFTRMAGQDPTVKEGLEILKGCLQGNVPNPETLQALLQKCQ